MTFVDGDAWQGNETYLLLWDSGGHPGGGADAVRRWVAPQGGSATITGSARDLDPSCGGGVVVSIRRNTTMLWQQTLANGNTAGIPFELTTAVGAGDNVDFVINRGANNDCDATGFDPTIVFTPGGPADTTPPGRSGGAPTGTLAAGTTQATLSLTTDESAICRYATTAGVAYAAMPTGFTTTGGTAHATTVTGLADGGSYSFFVRCQDLAGNANPDDMVIGFSVALGGGSTTYRASTDFSSTQGFRNWFYLYGAGTPMTFVDGDAWQGNETYLLLWDSGGHPGGGADAVRRWVAPEEGAVTITGSAMDLDSSCGGGVVVSIRRNGMVLWQQTLANGDAAGVPFDVVTAVLAGDNVDFVINRGANNDCDATGFDPTIVFTPQ
jgi:hypothetical protein